MQKLFICLILFLCLKGNAQEFPSGYIKYFESKHNNVKNQTQYINSPQSKSKELNGIYYMEVKKDSIISFTPPAIFLVDNLILGDFIADVSVKTNAELNDSLSGLYILSGLRDSANYYFLQLNNRGVGFNKMYKGEISLIKHDSSFTLSQEVWHKFRIKRDILNRTISIETKNSFIEFKDPNLIMGYFGFGVNNYTMAMKNLVIWAPTAINKPSNIFVNY